MDKVRPIFDTTNMIIRCVGRQQAMFSHQKILPLILLPPDHQVTKLIIWDLHKHESGHLKGLNMIKLVRAEYWIPRLRQQLKKILKHCVDCNRQHAKVFREIPAQLPITRVRVDDPFAVTGVDFAGPFTVTPNFGTTQKVKAYVVLFTCAVTRAIHLEVVVDQSVNSFINAFRRFIILRFCPKTMYSDNAACFRAAAKYMRQMYQSKRVHDYLSKRNIVWRFSPSLAPWWGGFWERMVKTTKEVLTSTMGRKEVDMDVFATFVTEASGIINSRPLLYFGDDDFALSPDQLLKGGFTNHTLNTEAPDVPDTLEEQNAHINAREQMRRKLVAEYWTAFNAMFLKDLSLFHVSKKGPSKGVQLGQVVLIKQDKISRREWKMAQITGITPGKDGIVRKVTLATIAKDGKKIEISRSIESLTPLEHEAGIIDREFMVPGPGDSITSSGHILAYTPKGGVSKMMTPEYADESDSDEYDGGPDTESEDEEE